MSITDVQEVFSGRAGSINAKYERHYTRVFDVTTSSPYVGPLAVRLDSRLPQIAAHYNNGLTVGDPLYEFDNGAFATDITADCEGDAAGGGIAWKVTVQYQPWEPFPADPMLWKIRVTFSGERTERVVDFDRNGIPIRNSAEDRFGDPVTVDDHITTLMITRNELVSAFDPGLASLYSDTINDATWNGFAAQYCKMGIISTTEEQYDSIGQVWYYKVTYPVQVGRKPWRKDLLDQGFNEIKGVYAAMKVVPIMNDGQPVSDPVALDGAGHRLPIGGTPVTLSYDVFEAIDWSGLNINLSLRLGV